ncbi:teichoic acids export ABC transporter ATP-binding subunit TagH [Bacillus niameyensis]|uniref:teichoic acids export ABC transporter ATP-binding subunit TagH n=1 Tax=Bacillus niameyensis TaxID=1522308 RepID=UPI000784C285|nr:teichoic acids export ABC transporter ATP-binding subunit TagH [Bacillus niameyensis]
MKPKVKLEGISKTYQLYNKRSDKIRDIFLPNKRKNNRTFHALKNVSFEIFEGETVGIVGINGSGKSTLSNILAEVIPPSSGNMEINGETSLIAISAGLNNQLSGLENIKLKCLMLGLKKDEISELTPQIIEFADIGQFIEQPVKNYSSGMKSRLGFAISAYTNPDILIVDEALSVGDKTFYKKCVDKIDEFKASGKTIIFISHSIGQMRSICDRVLWLHYGSLKEFGNSKEVLDKYDEFIKWFNTLSKEEKGKYKREKLNEQSVINTNEFISRRSKSKVSNRGFIVQVCVLLMLTLFSALFMFVDKSPLAIYKGIYDRFDDSSPSTDNLGEEKNYEPEINKIDKEGNIVTRSAILYEDEQMTRQMESVQFSEPVYVIEQIDNVYKVNYQDETAYINFDDVSLSNTFASIADIRTIDFYPILPASLQSSYEFFMAHVGLDYETIKGKLRGLTEETEDQGLTVLTYGNYDISLRFNKDNVATNVIVENIQNDNEFLNELRSQANVQSKDGKMFTLNIEGFDVFVDIDKQILELTLQKNNDDSGTP